MRGDRSAARLSFFATVDPQAQGANMDGLDQIVERYHVGLGDFVNGDPRPVLELMSQREDVTLCNPLGPIARGPKEVTETSEQAASHMGGGVHEVEMVTTFATPELAYTVHMERFRATVDAARVQVRCALPPSSAWKTMVGGLHIGTRTR